MSLTKKATYNAYTGFIFFLVKMIVTFIMNPIIIGVLGSTHFGIWKAVENLLGFASIADGKATQALKWVIANQESSDDYDKKRRAIGSALLVWFLFLPILLICISTLTYFAPTFIKDISPNDYDLVYHVFIVLGINLIITPLFGISESIIIGTNRGWLANLNHLVWTILSAISMYLVLIYGYGLKGLVFVIFGVSILRGLNILWLCKKNIVWFGIKRPERKEIKVFFNFSSWVLSWSFIAKFLLGSEVLLLGIMIGPEIISKYSFTSYAAITGVSLAAVLMSSMTPGLGKLFGSNEYEKCRSVVNKIRELVFAFSIFFGSVILLLNKSFVCLWEGEEIFLGSFENLVIVILMIQLILIRNEGFLIDLGLKLRVKVVFGLSSVVIIFFLAYIGFFFVSEKIWIILLSIFLGRLLLSFAFPFLVGRILKKKTLMIPLKNLIVAFLLIVLTSLSGEYQSFDSWASFIAIGFIEVIVLTIIVYYLLLSIDGRATVFRLLSPVIKYFKMKD
jgi:O-antigen/teichoic acid export membrane protein